MDGVRTADNTYNTNIMIIWNNIICYCFKGFINFLLLLLFVEVILKFWLVNKSLFLKIVASLLFLIGCYIESFIFNSIILILHNS